MNRTEVEEFRSAGQTAKVLRGFGFAFSASGTRRWYVGADGVKRWADNDKPVDA